MTLNHILHFTDITAYKEITEQGCNVTANALLQLLTCSYLFQLQQFDSGSNQVLPRKELGRVTAPNTRLNLRMECDKSSIQILEVKNVHS